MAIETERFPSPRRMDRLFVRDMKPEFCEEMSIFEVDSIPRAPFNLKRFERRDRCEL